MRSCDGRKTNAGYASSAALVMITRCLFVLCCCRPSGSQGVCRGIKAAGGEGDGADLAHRCRRSARSRVHHRGEEGSTPLPNSSILFTTVVASCFHSPIRIWRNRRRMHTFPGFQNISLSRSTLTMPELWINSGKGVERTACTRRYCLVLHTDGYGAGV